MLWGEKGAVDALNQPDDSRIGELWRCQEHFIHTLSMLWMLWALCYCYEKYQPQYKIKLFLDSTVEIGSGLDHYYSVVLTTKAGGWI